MKKMLILPFFGAKDKHMMIYKKIYSDLIPGIEVDILKYNIKDAITYKGWNLIRKGKYNNFINHNNYDLVHSFSGGSLVLFNLKDSGIFNYNRVIFDSGPFWPTSEQTSNYICNIMGINNNNTKNIIKNTVELYWKYEKCDIDKLNIDYNKWLYSNNNSLCLYDKNDIMLDINKINKWVLETGSNSIIFEKTQHVQLYKYNKELYLENILKFLSP